MSARRRRQREFWTRVFHVGIIAFLVGGAIGLSAEVFPALGQGKMPTILLGVWAVIAGAISCFHLRARTLEQRREAGRCQHCGCDLVSVEGRCCPECGPKAPPLE